MNADLFTAKASSNLAIVAAHMCRSNMPNGWRKPEASLQRSVEDSG